MGSLSEGALGAYGPVEHIGHQLSIFTQVLYSCVHCCHGVFIRKWMISPSLMGSLLAKYALSSLRAIPSYPEYGMATQIRRLSWLLCQDKVPTDVAEVAFWFLIQFFSRSLNCPGDWLRIIANSWHRSLSAMFWDGVVILIWTNRIDKPLPWIWNIEDFSDKGWVGFGEVWLVRR